MDESLKGRIIHAAQTGQLTEEQYELYLKLLEEDPDFEDDVKWEGFLDKYLPISLNQELYEAASQLKMPQNEQVMVRFNYAVAAGICLLLISGWLAYQYIFNKHDEPRLAITKPVEFFSGDSISEGQLGYAEGDLAVGEKVWKLWEKEDQPSQISYQFCNDTLQLYFKKIEDTTRFVTANRLTYFSDSDSYYLISKTKLPAKLSLCTDQPQPLYK